MPDAPGTRIATGRGIVRPCIYTGSLVRGAESRCGCSTGCQALETGVGSDMPHKLNHLMCDRRRRPIVSRVVAASGAAGPRPRALVGGGKRRPPRADATHHRVRVSHGRGSEAHDDTAMIRRNVADTRGGIFANASPCDRATVAAQSAECQTRGGADRSGSTFADIGAGKTRKNLRAAIGRISPASRTDATWAR